MSRGLLQTFMAPDTGATPKAYLVKWHSFSANRS